LSQMGRAVAAYTGDYGGYLASWGGWGGATAAWGVDNGSCWMPVDAGLYTRNGDTIRTGGVLKSQVDDGRPYAFRVPHVFYRTLFNGTTELTPNGVSGGGALRPAGRLNAGPVGLGLLADGGYMSDLRTFFCPSTGDAMPADAGQNMRETPLANVVASMSKLGRAGGFDAKTAMMGTWTGQPLEYITTSINPSVVLYYLAIQGAYNYRCVPSVIVLDQHTEYGASATGEDCYGKGVRIRHVRPNHLVRAGEPIFKTQRLLGDRALVTDTFSRGDLYESTTLKDVFPGKGLYAHREGYNTLYGDGGARWYGDPQRTNMWWPGSTGSRIPQYPGSPQTCGVYQWTTPAGVGGYTRPSSVGIWHLFDVANGVDVEAP